MRCGVNLRGGGFHVSGELVCVLCAEAKVGKAAVAACTAEALERARVAEKIGRGAV